MNSIFFHNQWESCNISTEERMELRRGKIFNVCYGRNWTHPQITSKQTHSVTVVVVKRLKGEGGMLKRECWKKLYFASIWRYWKWNFQSIYDILKDFPFDTHQETINFLIYAPHSRILFSCDKGRRKLGRNVSIKNMVDDHSTCTT
jgi:hypothetical protein